MKRYKEYWEPCVVCPASFSRPKDEHVIHGTEGRAKRNASMTSYLGYYYHRHPFIRRTLWGLITLSPKKKINE